MPSRDDLPEALVDTSVAVAMLVSDHEHHEEVLAATTGRRLGLAGHALFETYSIRTRLPGAARRKPNDVLEAIRDNFPVNCFLSPERCTGVLDDCAEAGVAGGAVYDFLVAAAALEHGLILLSRDSRAALTYAAAGVSSENLNS